MVQTRSKQKRTVFQDIGNILTVRESKAEKPVRSVRFSRTVRIRECALEVGDMRLCKATAHCPRICRYNPLPVVLTDEVLREYTVDLVCWGQRPLSPQTMESQMRRLVACGHPRSLILQQANQYWHGYDMIHSTTTLQRVFAGYQEPFSWEMLDSDDYEAEFHASRGEGTNHLDVIKAFLSLQTAMHKEGNRGDVHELSKFYKKLQKKHSPTRPYRKKARALHFDLTGEKDVSARSMLHDILTFGQPLTKNRAVLANGKGAVIT